MWGNSSTSKGNFGGMHPRTKWICGMEMSWNINSIEWSIRRSYICLLSPKLNGIAKARMCKCSQDKFISPSFAVWTASIYGVGASWRSQGLRAAPTGNRWRISTQSKNVAHYVVLRNAFLPFHNVLVAVGPSNLWGKSHPFLIWIIIIRLLSNIS